MEQILCIHIGQAGIQVGIEFWKLLIKEHGLNYQGEIENEPRGYIESMFSEDNDGKCSPRAIFWDLDPYTIDKFIQSDIGTLINPDNLVVGKESASSNFSKGHCSAGKEIIPELLDKIQHLINECDNLRTIAIFSSVSGGTGGGLSSLLLEKLCVSYTKFNRICFNIIPSLYESESVIVPLSFVLAFRYFIENAHLNILYENSSLAKICEKFLKIENPSLEDMNKIIALSASSTLTASRFPSSSDFNVQKLIHSMVPYPTMHFVNPSYAPFSLEIDRKDNDFALNDIVKSVLDDDHCLNSCEQMKYPDYWKRYGSVANCFQFRGEVEPGEVATSLESILPKLRFPGFIPRGINSYIWNEPCTTFEDITVPKAVHMLEGSTRIYENFCQYSFKYDITYTKRHYVSWIIGEGLDSSEMDESREIFANLIRDYNSNAIEYYFLYDGIDDGEGEGEGE